MSFDAFRWAIETHVGKSSAKMVLFCLADRADKNNICWPSIARLSSDTELNRKTVLAGLQYLEKAELITIKKTHGKANKYALSGRIIKPKTGTNSGTSPENGTGTNLGTTPVPNQGLHQSQNRDYTSTDLGTLNLSRTYQEPIKNQKEPVIKKKKAVEQDVNRFDEFYETYPRKQAREQAVKAWNKLKPDDDLINRLLEDVQERLKAGQYALDQKSFIPLPATYLNGKRWTDDIITRGENHETRQRLGGSGKLSAVDRVRQANDCTELDQQIRDALAEEAFEASLDSPGGDLRQRGGQSVGGDDAGDVGRSVEGVLVN